MSAIKYLKKNILPITGVLMGALGGYLYYYYVGCASGTCAITSRPVNSTVYGSLLGWLLFSSFKKSSKADKHEYKKKISND